MAKIAKHLSDLSLLDASEGRALSLAAQKHLEACSLCRAEVAGMRSAAQAFAAPNIKPPRELSRAIRERLGLRPKTLQQPWLRWGLAGAGLAAALLLFLKPHPDALPLPQESAPQIARAELAQKAPVQVAARPTRETRENAPPQTTLPQVAPTAPAVALVATSTPAGINSSAPEMARVAVTPVSEVPHFPGGQNAAPSNSQAVAAHRGDDASPKPSPTAGYSVSIKQNVFKPDQGQVITIEVQLTKRGRVSLKLLRGDGTPLGMISDSDEGPGLVKYAWNGTWAGQALASGIYFLLLETPEGGQRVRAVLVR